MGLRGKAPTLGERTAPYSFSYVVYKCALVRVLYLQYSINLLAGNKNNKHCILCRIRQKIPLARGHPLTPLTSDADRLGIARSDFQTFWNRVRNKVYFFFCPAIFLFSKVYGFSGVNT